MEGQNPMPPKAAKESSRVKPKVGIVAGNGQGAHRVYLSRIAGFLPREMCNLFHWGVFLSFFRRLRKDKRKSNRSSKSCQIRKAIDN
ncbi:MAG: hypothetical protein JSW12_02850 [Deltaproteobacteria bacterium]|nr:MAG: hypothetical protein JSW12_02850 [Deltaproteobacteria bacterium]